MISKLLLNSDTILFDTGNYANFIFKVNGLAHDFDLRNINPPISGEHSYKITELAWRLNELERLGFEIRFHSIQSDKLKLNLELIDSRLPEILGYLVYCKSKYDTVSIVDLLSLLKAKNPLKLDFEGGHPIYEVKLKAFLSECAFGLRCDNVWTGTNGLVNDIIIVKKSGKANHYNPYLINSFQDYLLNSARVDHANFYKDCDNAKMQKFGWVYENNGELFIKLNLQIRFK